jgi:hypothetical protein
MERTNYGRDEIPVGPKAGKALLEPGEFLPQQMGRMSLHALIDILPALKGEDSFLPSRPNGR